MADNKTIAEMFDTISKKVESGEIDPPPLLNLKPRKYKSIEEYELISINGVVFRRSKLPQNDDIPKYHMSHMCDQEKEEIWKEAEEKVKNSFMYLKPIDDKKTP